MIFTVPFSVAFWICYLCSGLSDLLDGYVARRLNQQSSIGAKLDSIADLFFVASIFIVVIKNIQLPVWLWLCIFLIGLLRIVGYGIGFYKYRAFSSLHTYMNKATGVLIFAFPPLCALIGFDIAGAIICFAAFISSVEELLITAISKELDRDCKCIFQVNSNQ